MSGYDRQRGSSRDPPDNRGGYYRQDDRGYPHGGSDRVDDYSQPQQRGNYGYPPNVGRRDSHPPRDGYGVGGPSRGEPEYGRFAPYDRGGSDRYGGPPSDRYQGYDRRDTYGDQRPRGLGGPGPYPGPPSRDDGYGYQEDRRGGPHRDVYDDRYGPQYRDQYQRQDMGQGGRGYPNDRAQYQNEGSENEELMELPAEVAKMVIGQQGKAIKLLQERTGAHVMIEKPQPGTPVGAFRQVRVRGYLQSVDAAIVELRQKLRDYEYGGGGMGGGMSNYPGQQRERYPGPLDRQQYEYGDRRGVPMGSYPQRNAPYTNPKHVEEKVPCPAEHRGLVIGKGGARVRKIEQDTGCHVHTTKGDDFVTLIGFPKSVAKAKVQIETMLRLAELPPMPEVPEKDSPHVVEVPVPSEAIGAVMGLGGSNIKILQCTTQCYMVWDKEHKIMKLWGSDEIVATGKAAVEKDIAEALASRDQRVAAAIERKQNEPDAGEQVSEEVEVHGHGGLVIGKGGATAKRITHESGAQINVDRQKQVVVISGSKETVEKGVQLVKEVLDQGMGNRPAEIGVSPGSAGQPVERAAWTNAASPEGDTTNAGEKVVPGLGSEDGEASA